MYHLPSSVPDAHIVTENSPSNVFIDTRFCCHDPTDRGCWDWGCAEETLVTLAGEFPFAWTVPTLAPTLGTIELFSVLCTIDSPPRTTIPCAGVALDWGEPFDDEEGDLDPDWPIMTDCATWSIAGTEDTPFFLTISSSSSSSSSSSWDLSGNGPICFRRPRGGRRVAKLLEPPSWADYIFQYENITIYFSFNDYI